MSSDNKRSISRKKRKLQCFQSENYVSCLPDHEDHVSVLQIEEFKNASGLSIPSFLRKKASSKNNHSLEASTVQNRENSPSCEPDMKDYSEAVVSAILSLPGVTLSSAEKAVNIFNEYLIRNSCEKNLLPSSRYFWDKRAKSNPIGVYVICDKGHSHGPFFGEPKDFGTFKCDENQLKVELNPDKYFLHVLFRPQLENYLSILPESALNPESIQIVDIYNSSQAKRVKRSYGDESIRRFTLTMHSDEVAVGNSSNASIFPIFFTVNEISKEFRRKNFFLVGLFVGHKKPAVEIYLGPIVDELISLSNEPITWNLNSNSMEKKATFHLVGVIADAPMRAYLRHVKQFNHIYGCDWCLVKADTFKGAREFPILDHRELEKLKRTREDFNSFEKYLENDSDPEAVNLERFHGITGLSPLLKLRDFDIVNGFSVEPMHCVVLGIFRSIIFKGWLKSEVSGILELKVDLNLFKSELSERLKKIKVPSEFPRVPRDFGQVKYWKSSEFDSLLCYYLLPAMKGLLRPKVINNILFLARIYFLLNSESSNSDIIAEIKNLVEEFQRGVLELYGKQQMTYNLHILSHLAESIDSLGAFANLSAYPLENQMGILKEKVRRTSNIAQNLVRVFLNDFKHKEFLQSKVKTWTLTKRELKNFEIVESEESILTLIPDAENIQKDLRDQIINALFDTFGIYIVSDMQNMKFYKSLSLNSTRFSTKSYCQDKTRNDSIVKSKDGKFFQIEKILELDGRYLFAGRKFKSDPVKLNFKGKTGNFSFKLDYLHEIKQIEESIEIFKFNDISKKGIFIPSSSFHFKYKYDFLVESFLKNK